MKGMAGSHQVLSSPLKSFPQRDTTPFWGFLFQNPAGFQFGAFSRAVGCPPWVFDAVGSPRARGRFSWTPAPKQRPLQKTCSMVRGIRGFGLGRASPPSAKTRCEQSNTHTHTHTHVSVGYTACGSGHGKRPISHTFAASSGAENDAQHQNSRAPPGRQQRFGV